MRRGLFCRSFSRPNHKGHEGTQRSSGRLSPQLSLVFLRALCGLRLYLVRISSRKSSARGSLLCPSQKIACLRTTGFLLVLATLISLGTASSSCIWLSAKTAFFF